ncbi:PREDICTED: linker for activation of T-cells family member 2 isoform X3 [Crocodylus porosus]|uniref:linker for activation of T-cells family member 2 isoform X3 n=1 Tax=Crocodylus porosus TaxID=8502 RepID=UPI00093D0CE3|nr:PREDICTED: linker for activation of T-cells family member 2 isoform X3 [Crocodylus porosus]
MMISGRKEEGFIWSLHDRFEHLNAPGSQQGCKALSKCINVFFSIACVFRLDICRVMAQVELLWAAASLMLLGALVGMCMKCQQSAAKRENKQLHQQRGWRGNRQTFEVIRTYSIPTTRLEQFKSADSDPVIRRSKELPTSDLDKRDQDVHAYQNVMVGEASQNAEPDDADDYENSAAIQMWKQSEMSASSEDDHDEPDYVNTGPGALPS